MGHENSLDRAWTDQRGSVLIGGLVLVLAVTLLGLALYQAATVETRDVVYTERDVHAFYAADTGLDRASLNVQNDSVGIPTANGGVSTTAPATCGAFAPGVVSNTFCDILNAVLAGTTPPAFLGSTPACFGSSTCDSSNPTVPGYVVTAAAALQPDGVTKYNDRFQLIAIACVPGPGANPCPAGSRAAAQVKAWITPATTTTTTTTSTTTTRPGAPFALFGSATTQTALDLGSGGSVDSYNSGCSSPPVLYNPSNPGTAGNLGGNGVIDIKGFTVKGNILNTTNVANPDVSIASATVTGNVQSGGTVSYTAGEVSGTVTQNVGTSPLSLTPVTFSKVCPGGFTTLTSGTGGNVIGVAGTDYTYSGGSLLIPNGTSNLTLNPGTYCFSYLESHGTLNVTGPTVVYVQGPVDSNGNGTGKAVVIKSGSYINNSTQLADNFQLIVTSNYVKDGVDINFSGDAYLVIDAPYTTVSVGSSGGNIFGAIMGESVVYRAQENIHFDQCLTGDPKLVAGVQVTTTTTTTTTTTSVIPNKYTLMNWKQPKCTQASPSSAWTCS